MKLAGIYDPYLDTLGGGERYCLTLACFLRDEGFEVHLFWTGSRQILQQAEDRFGLKLEGIKLVNDIFAGSRQLLRKYGKTKPYDVIFYASDGSIPFLFARTNWLHLQVPFKGVSGKSLINQIKLKLFKRVIVNSNFTKKVIDQEFGIVSEVVYPPVDEALFRPLRKKKIILATGRFSNLLQSKSQPLLIRLFKELVDEGKVSGWELQLAGGTGVGADKHYIEEFKKSVSGYPIRLVFDPEISVLAKLYGEASIYWTASGFGNDPMLSPQKVEHFGISLVEAMSAGCVPLAVGLGGFPEILTGQLAACLWETTAELKEKTLSLTNHPDHLKRLSALALKRSSYFTAEVFRQNIRRFLEEDVK